MPIEPILHRSHAPAARTTAEKETNAAQLIVELEGAGLLSFEVDDDGDISFVLTRRGRRAAHLTAMSRDGYALVLLGALVGTSRGPN